MIPPKPDLGLKFDILAITLRVILLFIFSLIFSACKAALEATGESVNVGDPEIVVMEDATETPLSLHAHVISVDVSGNSGSYQFSVQIESADTGCEQYTDWWEVLTEDGQLIYRRILTHSHVDEQPFIRSGGPVGIDMGTVVIVRAHMHPGGYGGKTMRGSVVDGFLEFEIPPDFAVDVESLPPQPDGCAF